MNLLHQITRAIGGREDLRSIYQVVLRSLEEDLGFDFGCICDYDPARQELTIIHVGVRSQPCRSVRGSTSTRTAFRVA